MRQSKASLQRAQARIKTQADQLQLDQVLNPGEWILLKLQLYKQQSAAQRINSKLTKGFLDLLKSSK